MRYIAAYLLLQLANPEATPSAADITKVVSAAGIDVDSERVEKLLAQLEGKNIAELIAEGKNKLASVPSGGAAPVGAAAAAGGAAPAAAEEKKEESEEESDDDMGFGLFD
ncbi:60S acidic ribosomal protein P2 [Coemansia sp. RSA 2706]|nr:60S acidic ribosomal protein P2 [Coemansia sp. RSA 2708]KAJ2303393.1 60S acidic ribosomal protein P2 [Coemansia sp. RSA 2706]KAJ2316030.1 60S acidic ribosomal protein P2 [Coemansia sp. RSA 2704]